MLLAFKSSYLFLVGLLCLTLLLVCLSCVSMSLPLSMSELLKESKTKLYFLILCDLVILVL